VSEPRRPPVFCDLCANLAAAELDGAPLCMTCLLREIGSQGAIQDIRRLVAPLRLLPPRESTPIPLPPPRLARAVDSAVPVDEAVSC